jgi:hypothetical protein
MICTCSEEFFGGRKLWILFVCFSLVLFCLSKIMYKKVAAWGWLDMAGEGEWLSQGLFFVVKPPWQLY